MKTETNTPTAAATAAHESPSFADAVARAAAAVMAAPATAPATAAATASATAAPAVGKAARERAVKDRDAARLIAAKKAEEKAAREASRKAGQSPETPETMAPGVDADAPSFPGFAARPTTVEKRKVAWREQAPALFAMLASLPPEIASVKTQRQPGKFDPTARRARVNVTALDAYARQLDSGDLREGLFYLVSTIRRVGEQNDIERRAVRSGTLTMFAGSTSTSASTKGYAPYDS